MLILWAYRSYDDALQLLEAVGQYPPHDSEATEMDVQAQRR